MLITDQNFPLLRALMTRVIEQRGPDRQIPCELPDDAFPLDVWEAELAAMSPQEFDDLLTADRALVGGFVKPDTSAQGFADLLFTAGIEVGK